MNDYPNYSRCAGCSCAGTGDCEACEEAERERQARADDRATGYADYLREEV